MDMQIAPLFSSHLVFDGIKVWPELMPRDASGALDWQDHFGRYLAALKPQGDMTLLLPNERSEFRLTPGLIYRFAEGTHGDTHTSFLFSPQQFSCIGRCYPLCMAAGRRIAEERRRLGMTQPELVRRIKNLGGDITQGGISDIETKDRPRPKCAPEAAIVLNLELKWLLTGRGPKHPQQAAAAARKLALVVGERYAATWDIIERVIDQALEEKPH